MIPYFEQPSWQLGPLTLYAFGVAVAIAFLVGLAVAERRFRRLGLDRRTGAQLTTWMLVGGILGAHLFSVLLYFPDRLVADPWVLLRVWEDISSFGGLVGGVIGGLAYFRFRRPRIESSGRIAFFDAVAFAYPGGLAVGRVGCALAHDHPGGITSLPLGVSLETEAAQAFIEGVYASAGASLPTGAESLAFHDLGLYECLFLSLIVVPAFAHWSRRPRPQGFFLVTFAALYLPIRFGLDMLRVSDARYVGLTPAQWVAALVLAGLPFAIFQRRSIRLAVTGVVVVATACACWAG